MSNLLISRLERVDLRQVWEREDIHFTQWLAQEENIKLLGDTLGIELVVQASEQAVGPFRADILCTDAGNDTMVLIENQLERTDHTHLGQLMTYAAGLDTATIIWVAKTFTEEHRAALDWLNRITEEKFNFFGVEVELWRIADSPVAPKFNIVSKPNNWSKAVRHQSRKDGSTTDEWSVNLLNYWIEFKSFLESSGSGIKGYQARADRRFNVESPATGYYLRAVRMQYNYETNDYSKGEIRVVLEAVSDAAKAKFAELQADPALMSEVFGNRAVHTKADGAKIFFSQTVDVYDTSDFKRQFKWLLEGLEKMKSNASNLAF
ncbi:MAG TPA: DUF4268 domain-containing protein [Blastocatellia bacterium]|nr:DUF4268 domain-containing protein [Blastocatellia bacterium]